MAITERRRRIAQKRKRKLVLFEVSQGDKSSRREAILNMFANITLAKEALPSRFRTSPYGAQVPLRYLPCVCVEDGYTNYCKFEIGESTGQILSPQKLRT